MISLSNVAEQVLLPGQSITFDLVLLQTRCGAERHRTGSANTELINGNIFNIDFSANIAGQAAGQVQLSIMLDGEALPAASMIEQVAAANNIYNVSRPGVLVRKIGCSNTISVRNTGTTNIILPAKSARLSVNRVA